MASQRDRGAGNDDRCAEIAAHGVKRDSNLLRHERPGNLILCCGVEAAAADWKSPLSAAIGEALDCAPAGPGQYRVPCPTQPLDPSLLRPGGNQGRSANAGNQDNSIY